MTKGEIYGALLNHIIVFGFFIWNWSQGHTIEAVLLLMYIQLSSISLYLKALYDNSIK